MTRRLGGCVLALVLGGCAAHDAAGRRVRTPNVRFDERSISGVNVSYRMEQDGTWAGPGGDRYRRDGDEIVKVGASPSTPSLIRPSGSVRIERRPDGVSYQPSWPGSVAWTFVTEDGKPLPESLEVPLYLLTRIELTGQQVDLRTPHSELAGIPLPPDCGLVLFDLRGRQVAGWAASKGARCPDPYYPEGALQRLVEARNETWETQLRPDHPG